MEDMQKELREAQYQEANLFMGYRDSEDILYTRRKELEHLNTQVMLMVPFKKVSKLESVIIMSIFRHISRTGIEIA